MTVVGRVCCDAEGRLNDQSVMLEGGVADSAGARVRLDLSQARESPCGIAVYAACSCCVHAHAALEEGGTRCRVTSRPSTVQNLCAACRCRRSACSRGRSWL